MYFANPKREFIIQTDASKTAIGWILQQKDDHGRIRIVHCGGRNLRKHEKGYGVTEIELLSLIHCITQIKHYLDKSLTHVVFSDHITLTFIKSMKNSTNGRLFRWALYLDEYQLDIRHKKGTSMAHVDYISRIEHDPDSVLQTSIIL